MRKLVPLFLTISLTFCFLLPIAAGWKWITDRRNEAAFSTRIGRMNQIKLATDLALKDTTKSTLFGSSTSWRVQLLPYLESKHLHDDYNHSVPWNSHLNDHILYQPPKLYCGESGNASEILYVTEQGSRVRPGGTASSFMVMIDPTVFGIPWTEPERLTSATFKQHLINHLHQRRITSSDKAVVIWEGERPRVISIQQLLNDI